MPLICALLFGINAWVFIDALESDRPSRKFFMASAAACMALNLAGMMH